MKKFIMVFAISALMILWQTNGIVNAAASYDGSYSIYERQVSRMTSQYLQYSEKIRTEKARNAQIAKLKARGVTAESVKFEGDNKDIDALIKRLRVKTIAEEKVENVDIIYGFSPRLRGFVLLDGERVNIQIARRANSITVGTPLIIGSY